MNKGRRTIPLGFTEETVPEGMHICYSYNAEAEREGVVGRFLESGLRAREKVLCLEETPGRSTMLERLASLDVPGHALKVLESIQGYCPSGVFRPDETLDLIKAFYLDAVEKEGFTGARGTGQMSWSLEGHRTRTDALLEYEARLDQLLEAHPYTACCQYDARLFSGKTLMDVLTVHPMVIIQGQLVKNPFYVGPSAFQEKTLPPS